MATFTASPKVGRNELCSCGSGKKSKRCCGSPEVTGEDTASRFFNVAAVLAGLMLVVGLVVSARQLFFVDASKTERVWSAEHGHWHEVGGAEASSTEAGPGKVWNEEHGHYHDAAGAAGSQEGSQQGGPGKVWNEEHGHYHDAAAPVLDAKKPVEGALEGLRTSELDAAREKLAEGEAAR